MRAMICGLFLLIAVTALPAAARAADAAQWRKAGQALVRGLPRGRGRPEQRQHAGAAVLGHRQEPALRCRTSCALPAAPHPKMPDMNSSRNEAADLRPISRARANKRIYARRFAPACTSGGTASSASALSAASSGITSCLSWPRRRTETGAFGRFLLADHEQRRDLGERVLAHLVIDLLVAQVALDAQAELCAPRRSLRARNRRRPR